MDKEKTKNNKFMCCVVDCPTRLGQYQDEDIGYHILPREGITYLYVTNADGIEEKVDRRKIWEMILLMKIPEKTTDRICSLHFQKDDFLPLCASSNVKKKLRIDAIPTLLLPQPNLDQSSSVKVCCVPGCRNISEKAPTKEFFTVTPNSNYKKWVLWVKALGLPTNCKRVVTVCSDHFLSGEMSSYEKSSDYVPSYKMPKKSKPAVGNSTQIEEPTVEFVAVEMSDPFTFIQEETSENPLDVLEDIIKIEPTEIIKHETDEHSYCMNN